MFYQSMSYFSTLFSLDTERALEVAIIFHQCSPFGLV